MAPSRPEQSQIGNNRHIAHRRWRDLVASRAHGRSLDGGRLLLWTSSWNLLQAEYERRSAIRAHAHLGWASGACGSGARDHSRGSIQCESPEFEGLQTSQSYQTTAGLALRCQAWPTGGFAQASCALRIWAQGLATTTTIDSRNTERHSASPKRCSRIRRSTNRLRMELTIISYSQ